MKSYACSGRSVLMLCYNSSMKLDFQITAAGSLGAMHAAQYATSCAHVCIYENNPIQSMVENAQ